jgi:putative protease
VNGRQQDIGAFDTPKHAGLSLGHVAAMTGTHFDVDTSDSGATLNNGDSITWRDLQGELQGVQVNTVEAVSPNLWRVEPNLAARPGAHGTKDLKDLRKNTALHRNRDMAWERLLAKPSAERKIAVDVMLTPWQENGQLSGLELTLIDEDGFAGSARVQRALEPARDPDRAAQTLQDQLTRLGTTSTCRQRSQRLLHEQRLVRDARALDRSSSCGARRVFFLRMKHIACLNHQPTIAAAGGPLA